MELWLCACTRSYSSQNFRRSLLSVAEGDLESFRSFLWSSISSTPKSSGRVKECSSMCCLTTVGTRFTMERGLEVSSRLISVSVTWGFVAGSWFIWNMVRAADGLCQSRGAACPQKFFDFLFLSEGAGMIRAATQGDPTPPIKRHGPSCNPLGPRD